MTKKELIEALEPYDDDEIIFVKFDDIGLDKRMNYSNYYTDEYSIMNEEEVFEEL